jgi:hypothetical protein
MKPATIALLTFIVSAAGMNAQGTGPAGLEATLALWGSTRDEVKATVSTGPVREDDQAIWYADTVLGYPAVLQYFFDAGRLRAVVCSLQVHHPNQTDYAGDYSQLKTTLSERHGQPSRDEAVWKSKIYKDEAEDWVTAVASGHLEYRASWETGVTRIDLAMKGGDNAISLVVSYTEAGVSPAS